ncbi:SMI1/KNR4 family protein [uncultured Ruminococcus sp.]|uniref:SMI1/KNR4 family protein n=1 Tax=uncultured Ruminococcus sp. TaxID=165186 RepID=UPI0025D61788|nr:SMI1/KNR4 family protein [uncultured Ruminococcus sp.]
MDIIELIRELYGDFCVFCPPLDESRYNEAKMLVPEELFEILKISNGIKETMELPNREERIVIGLIIYPFDDIRSQTERYINEYSGEGVVFVGNGADGFFILKSDGKVYFRGYLDEDEELYADSLAEYFRKWHCPRSA